MDIAIVIIRTIIFYFLILACFRIMGKREIGQLSISDLTISILIAELVAISIENRNDNMLLTILPIITLVLFEIVLAYVQLKFNTIKNVMDGTPSLIINKGKLNIKEMVKQRYGISDLLLQLRNNGIANINDVNFAVLENNGKLSIFKKDDNIQTPLPLIVDGIINMDVLFSINKSMIWLEKELYKEDISINDVLYAFYNKNKIFIIKK